MGNLPATRGAPGSHYIRCNPFVRYYRQGTPMFTHKRRCAHAQTQWRPCCALLGVLAVLLLPVLVTADEGAGFRVQGRTHSFCRACFATTGNPKSATRHRFTILPGRGRSTRSAASGVRAVAAGGLREHARAAGDEPCWGVVAERFGANGIAEQSVAARGMGSDECGTRKASSSRVVSEHGDRLHGKRNRRRRHGRHAGWVCGAGVCDGRQVAARPGESRPGSPRVAVSVRRPATACGERRAAAILFIAGSPATRGIHRRIGQHRRSAGAVQSATAGRAAAQQERRAVVGNRVRRVGHSGRQRQERIHRGVAAVGGRGRRHGTRTPALGGRVGSRHPRLQLERELWRWPWR